MATSAEIKLSIINQALRHLGMRKISNLTGTDPSTLVMLDFFDPCVEEVLGEIQWPFATVQAVLVESSETALLGWVYMYNYPTQNAATVWTVFNESTASTKHEQDFEVMYYPGSTKKVILSNLDVAYMEYSYLNVDFTLWQPKAKTSLSYRLAAECAHSLTGDEDKGIKLMNIYNAFLGEGKRIAGANKKKVPQQTSNYQSAR